MPNDPALGRSVLSGIVAVAAVAALAACAPPLILDMAPAPAAVAVQAPQDEAAEPATVQLRYFPFSPEVAVVAWVPTENGFGLRGAVRRDGSRIRDHNIFVSTYYDPAVRSFPLAAVPSMPLLMTGVFRDTYSCWFGDCTPAEVFGARVPDEVLRTAGDSVTVRFYGREQRELFLTLRRDLIVAYLAAMDSVSATLRRRS